jgi:tetratricopeptide (TPR) repeat protein
MANQTTTHTVLDSAQLERIQAVHRGYLYQHLYSAACLLLAQQAGVRAIIVEHDEDIEISLHDRRIYVQVKTRSSTLNQSDIVGALERFAEIRTEHASGQRVGAATFVVAANVAPGPALKAAFEANDWPKDVSLHWPGCEHLHETALPDPFPDLTGALAYCSERAATLPFAMLAPETLVWKLSSLVMAAAAGNPPRIDHSFSIEELPTLFEQLVIQLQDFPAPPAVYRAQEHEPSLQLDQKLRIIVGYSGAGKTAWVAQAATQVIGTFAYYDVVDTPGPALASSLARELAARLFGRSRGALGEILLPGATGPEILHSIGQRMAERGETATVVIDNGHRIPPGDLATLVQHGHDLHFIILCQPGRNTAELEALLQTQSEPLQGWSTDTIALEATTHGCRADFATCDQLLQMTGGLPLYVQNAMEVAKTQNGGELRAFCSDLSQLTHEVETAQELILTRLLEGLSETEQRAVAALSLCDIPMLSDEAKQFLGITFGLNEKAIARAFRQLRTKGLLESYSDSRVKIHDAIRLVGRGLLEASDAASLQQAQAALSKVLSASLLKQWDLSKLHLYLRMLVANNEVKTLVQFVTDEMFHELGVLPEILQLLETAASSESTDAEDRFWALDGLIFAALKRGNLEEADRYQEAAATLLAAHPLGPDENLAIGMKRLHIQSAKGDETGMFETISSVLELLPDTPQHLRIFRYNAAHAMFKLGMFEPAIEEALDLIKEYYDLIGLDPRDVMGRNAPELFPLIKRKDDCHDDLKHLADSLDLHAQACHAAGTASPFGRIHAMKFYEMARAFDSLIRVGQDLADDFVERHDFVGARQVIENNLLPMLARLKLLDRIVPVRSQYAVVLAYCGDFDAAKAEMARLLPYRDGLNEEDRDTLTKQSNLVARLAITGAPPQWVPPLPIKQIVPRYGKAGRNAPCPCGSGKKYKKCHGK